MTFFFINTKIYMLLCRVTYVENVDIEEVKTALTIITSCMKNVG